VALGSLVEQWQDEMAEKFGLDITLFCSEMVEQSRGNAFEDADLMVASVDQLSRSEDLLDKLRLSQWDLVVIDEARLSWASIWAEELIVMTSPQPPPLSTRRPWPSDVAWPQ
jgi:superfamily II DNA or RNA helicase